MGVISDQLKARLDEMRVRHAETDRQVAESREQAYEALAKMQAIARDMERL